MKEALAEVKKAQPKAKAKSEPKARSRTRSQPLPEIVLPIKDDSIVHIDDIVGNRTPPTFKMNLWSEANISSNIRLPSISNFILLFVFIPFCSIRLYLFFILQVILLSIVFGSFSILFKPLTRVSITASFTHRI